jgi:hypothetical protein
MGIRLTFLDSPPGIWSSDPGAYSLGGLHDNAGDARHRVAASLGLPPAQPPSGNNALTLLPIAHLRIERATTAPIRLVRLDNTPANGVSAGQGTSRSLHRKAGAGRHAGILGIPRRPRGPIIAAFVTVDSPATQPDTGRHSS